MLYVAYDDYNEDKTFHFYSRIQIIGPTEGLCL